jgi:hypothetical protein
MIGVEGRATSVERLKGRDGGRGAATLRVDKEGLIVLDGATLLMISKVKQNPVIAHCCAVMRLPIWRATEGNLEGII